MKERNTKQKRIILEELENDYTHPTIQKLYKKIQKRDSSIGQATVYRNVNKLVDEGKVLKISLGNGIEHYDGHCHTHYHLLCTKCEKIYDLEDQDEYLLRKRMEDKYHIRINKSKIVFEGVCRGCLDEEV